MPFQLADVLMALGPNAAIIFAAWIFLSFLQARYDSAVDRHRMLVETYRGSELGAERRKAVKRQIEVYTRRCTLMSHAVTIGLVSATLFLLTMIGSGLDVIMPDKPFIGIVTSIAALVGFGLVIVAAVLVIMENAGTPGQIREELQDIEDVSGRSSARSAKLTP
jgi:hypothetical protein